jgi:HAD superfamily hydrolase (TIGR01509 family)
MNGPAAILFDLGGTLLREESFAPEAWADTLNALQDGPRPLAPDAVRELVRQLVWEFRRPGKEGMVEVRMEACLRHLHDRLGVSPRGGPAELELAFWQATCRMSAEPGVAHVLAALVRRGLPLGVVSNSMFRAEVLAWELGRNGLASHFRFVLSSADYALRKPHPSLFRTALARLGLAAQEVWFVGDSHANDVTGAAAVGMQAVWYNSGGAVASAGTLPHAEVRDWDGFLRLCERAWGSRQ